MDDYKRFKMAFKNHMKVHHGTSRKNKMFDKNYQRFSSASSFEIISLTLITAAHFPIYFISPTFFFTVLANVLHYYYVHRKSHLDVDWGKKNLPWHYEHHMGKNQNINWGIRSPLIDKLAGTSKY